MVVALPPVRGDDACFVHGLKFFAVQTLVPKPAVEALHEAVLPWATWFDIGRPHINCLCWRGKNVTENFLYIGTSPPASRKDLRRFLPRARLCR